MLKPMEFMATAPAIVPRGTMSPTVACQEGAFMAVPQPMRNVNPSSAHGVMCPNQAKAQSATERMNIQLWQASITRRRG